MPCLSLGVNPFTVTIVCAVYNEALRLPRRVCTHSQPELCQKLGRRLCSLAITFCDTPSLPLVVPLAMSSLEKAPGGVAGQCRHGTGQTKGIHVVSESEGVGLTVFPLSR